MAIERFFPTYPIINVAPGLSAFGSVEGFNFDWSVMAGMPAETLWSYEVADDSLFAETCGQSNLLEV